MKQIKEVSFCWTTDNIIQISVLWWVLNQSSLQVMFQYAVKILPLNKHVYCALEGGAHGVKVIVIENGHGDTSSNFG